MSEVLRLHPSLFNAVARYRSISIFAIYFIIIGWLLIACASTILAHWKPLNKKRLNHYSLFLFASLAVFSLITTWYYMISFLIQSYQDWVIIAHPDPALSALSSLRGWLNETYLFEQAWAAIIETEPRFWWTNQIFAFTSIWSVFLGIEGSRHHIASIWIFMVLGQLVAISFAANLSFLLVLLARGRQSKASHTETTNRDFGLHIAAIIYFACVASIRFAHGDKRFSILLLIPHLVGFAPMTPWLKPDTSVYYTVILLATSLFSNITWQNLANGWTFSDFVVALHEYPAMSSAGWDVIFCWISFTAWVLIN